MGCWATVSSYISIRLNLLEVWQGESGSDWHPQKKTKWFRLAPPEKKLLSEALTLLRSTRYRGSCCHHNRSKCLDKFYTILDPNQFIKPDQNPKSYMKNGIQRKLRVIKQAMSHNAYSKLYPSGLCSATVPLDKTIVLLQFVINVAFCNNCRIL